MSLLLPPSRPPAMSAEPCHGAVEARPRARPSDCNVSETGSSRAGGHRQQTLQSGRAEVGSALLDCPGGRPPQTIIELDHWSIDFADHTQNRRPARTARILGGASRPV